MIFSVYSVFEAILLVTALSVDAFVASFAYGTNHIKIPFRSVVVINVICSFILAVTLILGAVLRPFISEAVTKAICFVILLLLGVAKLFDSSIKSCIRKHNGINKEFNFSVFQLRCILSIYADPEEADRDCSRLLSPAEAASLAVALSLDGLAVGFGAGLADVSITQVVFFSLILGTLAVEVGCFLGNKVAQKLNLNLSWLSGALLLLLAIMKLQ